MLEMHVLHQNRGFEGCSIEIFRLESWEIVKFWVIDHVRILSIIDASRKYGDDLHNKLQDQLSETANLTIFHHKNCVSKYTSKSNVTKYALRNVAEEPLRKLRKSSAEFNLKKTIVSIVERFVTLWKTQRTLRYRDMPFCAAPDTRCTIKGHTKSFWLIVVELVMMNGPVRSHFGWRGLWIWFLQRPDITGIACASLWPSETCN